MRFFAWALWLILFVLLFGFAVNNTATAELHLFAWTWQEPIVILLLIFFIAGFVFGLLAMLPTWFKLRLKLRRLAREAPARSQRRAPEDVSATGPDTLQNVAQGARETS